jgi:hypothetical protein
MHLSDVENVRMRIYCMHTCVTSSRYCELHVLVACCTVSACMLLLLLCCCVGICVSVLVLSQQGRHCYHSASSQCGVQPTHTSR